MKKIFIIAGESSGDAIGAKFIRALKQSKNKYQFFGIGGEEMIAEGVDSIFPMHELAVMGLIELIPHIPNVLKRIELTVQKIAEVQPDIVITIDSPGFCFRVAKRVKPLGVKLLHVVAPSVWAWKPERAKKIAAIYDHLLALLPFEAEYFEKEGLKTSFIGHPVIEEDFSQVNKTNFRAAKYVPSDVPLVSVMPGSRSGEVKRLLEIFKNALTIASRKFFNLHVVVITPQHLAEYIKNETKKWPFKMIIVSEKSERKAAMLASNVALAKSGTVTMELALAKIPMVIAYKVSAISAYLARKMLKIKYVNLVNIIAGKEIYPEFLQDRCTAELLATSLTRLLSNTRARETQINESQEVLKSLGLGKSPSPSKQAAKIIEKMLSGEST